MLRQHKISILQKKIEHLNNTALPFVMLFHIQNLELLQDVLSVEEQRLMERFLHPYEQQRRFVSFALRRLVLSWIHKQSPQTLNFKSNAYGRPFLPSVKDDFNISHSGDWIAFLYSPSFHLYGTCGVDVQEHGCTFDDAMMHFCLSEEEKACNEHLHTKDRFALFAQKEAASKALGLGLHLPFHQLVPKPLQKKNACVFVTSFIDLLPSYSLSVAFTKGNPTSVSCLIFHSSSKNETYENIFMHQGAYSTSYQVESTSLLNSF